MEAIVTDKPNIFPIYDPIGAVVWGMDTSTVDTHIFYRSYYSPRVREKSGLC